MVKYPYYEYITCVNERYAFSAQGTGSKEGFEKLFKKWLK